LSAPRTALITGAAKRIGRAIALDLAAHGFAVALHCKTSRFEAEILMAEITSRGGRASVLQADLENPDSADGLVHAAEASLGPVDVLVNNASLFEDDRVPDVSAISLERHYRVNVMSPVLLAQSFARALPPEHDGLIVNIIDQRVWKLTPQFFAYTLSKAALWTATQTLAQALAPRIRVVGLAPGPTLANPMEGAQGFQQEVAGTLLGRGPDLSEFGAAIRFAYDARSLTGQLIALDGGQHLAWRTPDVVA